MAMTAPVATIVDNRTGDATSIDARAFGALKAFLRALGATYADEGEADARLITGQAARIVGTSPRTIARLIDFGRLKGARAGGGYHYVMLSALMDFDRRSREGDVLLPSMRCARLPPRGPLRQLRRGVGVSEGPRVSRPVRVLIDANVFVATWTLDVLLTLADRGAVEPIWSKAVLDEAREAVNRVHGTDAGADMEWREWGRGGGASGAIRRENGLPCRLSRRN